MGENTRPKKKSEYLLENVPHDQTLLEKKGVVKNTEITKKKKEFEYSSEDVLRD